MVLVFCACINSPVCWAESQQQIIEAELENVLDSSGDDALAIAFMAGLAAHNSQFSFPDTIKSLLLVAGSDAYPSVILHGPPARDYPA